VSSTDTEVETAAASDEVLGEERIEKTPSPGHGGEPEGKPMTFWEHLEELRKRLMWSIGIFLVACAGAWNFHDQMLDWLFVPYKRAWIEQHLPGTPALHFGAPTAQFGADFKIAMIGGAAFAAPFIFYQLWGFVAPGLYAKEKRYVIPFVLLSSALFVGGAYFGWRAAFPISFNYFLSLSSEAARHGLVVVPTVMMGDYIDFCFQMLLGFGLVFEMPLLLLFLSIAGVINYLTLIKFIRYFILLAFVVAAVVTPPDVPDQLAMALPMCLLYGVSILLVYLFGKKPTPEQIAAFKARKQKKA
jgi:sec-independent protein translocase protein TatC